MPLKNSKKKKLCFTLVLGIFLGWNVLNFVAYKSSPTLIFTIRALSVPVDIYLHCFKRLWGRWIYPINMEILLKVIWNILWFHENETFILNICGCFVVMTSLGNVNNRVFFSSRVSVFLALMMVILVPKYVSAI